MLIFNQPEKKTIDEHEMKASMTEIPRYEQTNGYILLGSVTEQLGQAANHLTDVFELCLRYNRTCVLPNFQNGEMSLDGKSIFHELYDVNKLPQELSWTTWDNFVNYLNNVDVAVIECSFGVELVGQHQRAQMERKVRFHSIHARFTTPPGCNLPSTTSWPANATEQTWNLEMLDNELLHSEADVVVFYHLDWRFPVPLHFLHDFKIDLSPTMFDHASKFRQKFGSYIHLQWRTEVRESETKVNFAECARCAAESILDMQKKKSIHTVYFSADIDLDGLPWSNSITYGNTSEAQQGLKVIQSMIPDLKTWRDLPTPRGSVYDLSTIGMLDRVIAMTSDFFVSGPPACARGGSYVKSIEEWRLAQLEINETSRMPPSKHVKNGNEKWECGAHENPAH